MSQQTLVISGLSGQYAVSAQRECAGYLKVSKVSKERLGSTASRWVKSLTEAGRESSCLRCCCVPSWGSAMSKVLHE